jgi:hypothetical protein
VRRSRAVLFGVSACALALVVAACSGEASRSPASADRLNFFQFNNADSLANYVNTWYAVSLWKVLKGNPHPSADIPAAARQQALNTVLDNARRVALPCSGAKLSVIAGAPTMVEFWTARCKIRTLPKGSVVPGAPTIEASLPPGLVAAPAEGCVLPQAYNGSIATFVADFDRNGSGSLEPVASADQAKPGTWYLGPCLR